MSTTESRFADLWDACAHRVQAYAMRHVDPDTAQDVVADTFLVAWRRLDVVPPDPLPWLLVVARNVMANRRRAEGRARSLDRALALLASVSTPESSPHAVAAERDTMLRALAALTDREREAILLVAWDGLAQADAAQVAGCTLVAFQVRLHRARRRLASLTDTDAPAPVRLAPRRAS